MNVSLLLLKQNLVMLLYLVIGYILYRKKYITKAGTTDLGRLLLYVVMPMVIIKSYIREFSRELMGEFLISFIASVLALALAILVSRLVFHKISVVREFGTAFSNAGFIGIPLVQLTLGNEAVFYVASFVALLNILQWTYGLLIITGEKEVINIKKVILNPIVISLVIGLLLFILPISFPESLYNVISSISEMNGPLAMIVLGTYVAQVNISDIFKDRKSYVSIVIRLLVIPLLTILLFQFMPEKYNLIGSAIILVASAPIGSNVAIFAQVYDCDYITAVKDICLSTICSIITMPCVVALASMV